MRGRIGAFIVVIGLALALAASAGATGLVNLPWIACYDSLDTGCTNPFASFSSPRADVAAMTSDGRHLYVAGYHVIVHYTRDPNTGALTVHDCIDEETGGNGDPTDCQTHFPGSQLTMNDAVAIALSPDAQQKDLYIAGSDGGVGARSIIHLHRDPTTGSLSFGECLAAVAGSTCSSFGTSTDPRAFPTGLAVSPDGQSVLESSRTFGAELLNFDRNPTTGVLTLHQCFTYNASDTSCTVLSTPPNQGNPNDFGQISASGQIAVSPDNQDVYTTLGVSGNGAVAHFARAASGALTYHNCIGNPGSGCPVTVAGDALNTVDSVAVSPDGEVYVTGGNAGGASAAVTHLRRVLTAGSTHGDLSLGNCLSWAGSSCGPWLSGAPGGYTPLAIVAFTSDGQGFYATALGYQFNNVQVSSGVLHFSRDTSATATHGDVVALTSCFAADNSVNTYPPCTHPPSSVTGQVTDMGAISAAMSPDDNQLYVPTGGNFGWGGLVQLGVASPSATTTAATAVTQTTAQLNGTVNPDGAATTYHFEYGTSTAYGTNVPTPDGAVGSDSTVHPESQAVTALTPATTYHFRIVATSSNGTSYGPDQTFTTGTPSPSAITGAASSVTQTAAQLNGSSNPNGSATTYHFEYGTSTAYGTNVPVPDGAVGSDSTVHSESQTVKSLTPATTYHVRIVATSAGGTTYGADQTFTTAAPPPPAPSATTGAASNVTSSSAQLNGTSNPNGVATTYHFEFGTSTAYGSNVPTPDGAVGSDHSVHSESQTISGLTPATTYHFRIVAASAAGTTVGADQVFTTPAAVHHGQPPVLSQLRLDPPKFEAARSGATTAARHRKRNRSTGTRVSYRDSTTATTTLTIFRVTSGIRHGRSCVALHGRAPKHSHRCTLLVSVGTFHHSDHAGLNSFRFRGRLAGRALAPGLYVLQAVAVDASGASRPVKARFTILS